MRDELLEYYERELGYLRRMGAEFAERYPKVAGRLALEATKCDDPHVERLLEGMAFLAARVHLRLDDDLPEVSQALLAVLYPQFVRPLPSMSVAQFELDPEQGKLSTGLTIPREAVLLTRAVGGVPCRFRTGAPLTLWPLEVADVQWTAPDRLGLGRAAADAIGALRLDLQCLPDVTFAGLELEALRLHLHGEGALATTLYELLGANVAAVVVRDPDQPTRAPLVFGPEVLRPAGFGEDEALLPYPVRTFAGHRLLQEYFAFPQKFLFVDLDVFGAVRAAGFGGRAEVVVLVRPFERPERRHLLETGLTRDTVRLGCVPVINLFRQAAEPILLTQRHAEYRLVADARHRRTVQVYDVESVHCRSKGRPDAVPFAPLHALRHPYRGDPAGAYWLATRREVSLAEGAAVEVWLAFADLDGRRVDPAYDVASASCLCFNGSLPSRLPFGDEAGDFELASGGPLGRIRAIAAPTEMVPPPLGKPVLWRLISHLALNHVSISDGGLDALREILRLGNLADLPGSEKQIQALTGLRSETALARLDGDGGAFFARGRAVHLALDEDQFAGAGAYLFAAVLDRFLAQYAALNSFVQLHVQSSRRRVPLGAWPPRAGTRSLV